MCRAHRFSIAIDNQAFSCWDWERHIFKHIFGKLVNVSKLWKAVPCGNNLDISPGCLSRMRQKNDIMRRRGQDREMRTEGCTEDKEGGVCTVSLWLAILWQKAGRREAGYQNTEEGNRC